MTVPRSYYFKFSDFAVDHYGTDDIGGTFWGIPYKQYIPADKIYMIIEAGLKIDRIQYDTHVDELVVIVIEPAGFTPKVEEKQ